MGNNIKNNFNIEDENIWSVFQPLLIKYGSGL